MSTSWPLPVLRFSPHACPSCDAMLVEPRAIATRVDDGSFELALSSQVADPDGSGPGPSSVLSLLEAIEATPVVQRQRRVLRQARIEMGAGFGLWMGALWGNAIWGASAAVLFAAAVTGLVLLVLGFGLVQTYQAGNAKLNEAIPGLGLPTGLPRRAP